MYPAHAGDRTAVWWMLATLSLLAPLAFAAVAALAAAAIWLTIQRAEAGAACLCMVLALRRKALP